MSQSWIKPNSIFLKSFMEEMERLESKERGSARFMTRMMNIKNF